MNEVAQTVLCLIDMGFKAQRVFSTRVCQSQEKKKEKTKKRSSGLAVVGRKLCLE